MPDMVNPYLALESFQQALLDGEIRPSLCPGHHDIYVIQDEPVPGEKRITYAHIEASGLVKALAIFAPVDPIEGCPCFGVGYAVAEAHRGQGLAKAIVESGIGQLRQGFGPHLSNRFPGFYVEALVALTNTASNNVASTVLNSAPERTTDEISGEPALRYERFVKWDL